ncbi:MAG: tetratricopeptide repeat protein, partial [Flavobacterium sp.]
MRKVIFILIFLFLVHFNYGQTEEFHLEKGIEYYLKNDYKNALIEYNEAIRINPNYCKPYCGIGMIKAEEGLYEEALIDYNKAIELDSKCTKGYLNRGITKSNLKDYSGALKDLNKAIELNND